MTESQADKIKRLAHSYAIAYADDNTSGGTSARDILCAAIDEMAREAARYRWLRDVGDANWRPFAIREGNSAEEANAAVDAAMAETERCATCACPGDIHNGRCKCNEVEQPKCTVIPTTMDAKRSYSTIVECTPIDVATGAAPRACS